MALLLFLAINAVSSRVRVENISMEPTLQPGYLLIVNKLAYKVGEPKHGDIVVFHYMGDKTKITSNALSACREMKLRLRTAPCMSMDML